MLTEKDYCDHDTCVALEEVGMLLKTQIVRSYAKEGILTSKIYPNRPSLYEAQKWLREVRGMLLQPTYLELSDEWICIIRNKNKRHGYSAQKQKNYEEALSEGIKGAVKILNEE